jgi:hypothetical protein
VPLIVKALKLQVEDTAKGRVSGFLSSNFMIVFLSFLGATFLVFEWLKHR